MNSLKYQDYVDLGIYPALDENGMMHFSKPNIDFIIDKYLKLKNQFEELKKRSEAEEDIFYSQFSMARASADYYEHECKSLREQIRDIKDYNERRVRFEEINKGLRRECQRYKKEYQELQHENARLQQQLKQAKEIINDPNTLMAQQSELIDNLTRQLAEKDKEIERLNKALEMCKHIERYDIGEMFLENAKLIIEKRQLAIQELEKVEELILKIDNNHTEIKTLKNGYSTLYVDSPTVISIIDQQIKELRGKNEEV